MRDPKRIPEVLAHIQAAWEREPDQRFGQLILNIYRSKWPGHYLNGPDGLLMPDYSGLFNVEDDAFVEAIGHDAQ